MENNEYDNTVEILRSGVSKALGVQIVVLVLIVLSRFVTSPETANLITTLGALIIFGGFILTWFRADGAGQAKELIGRYQGSYVDDDQEGDVYYEEDDDEPGYYA